MTGDDVLVTTHTPLLGTDVTVRVERCDATAAAIDERIVAEIDRLESILSRFRPDSALERWKRGDLEVIPPELAAVFARADRWRRQTGGVLDATADSVASAVGGVEIHAFAKGWIVDRALEAVSELAAPHPEGTVMIVAGGDIARRGFGTTTIGVDDPRRRDNAPPLDRVLLGEGGLATSGPTRRGVVDADGTLVSHIIDPMTGAPAVGTLSVSVLADSGEDADAWATTLSIGPVESIVERADQAGVGVLALTDDGEQITNDRWRDARVR